MAELLKNRPKLLEGKNRPEILKDKPVRKFLRERETLIPRKKLIDLIEEKMR